MKKEELFELLGDINETYLKGAEEPMKKQNSSSIWTRLGAMAAVVALMLCSGTVGALAFGRERVVEVPVQQETIALPGLGLTLVLPDDWAGRYEVVEDIFEPYGTPMWEVCVKMVYDAKSPTEEYEDLLYRGTLFYVFQCEDHPMSAREFEEDSGIAGIGRYLFATENATYAIMYATDVQCDPNDPAQQEEYTALAQSMKGIGVLVDGLMQMQ